MKSSPYIALICPFDTNKNSYASCSPVLLQLPIALVLSPPGTDCPVVLFGSLGYGYWGDSIANCLTAFHEISAPDIPGKCEFSLYYCM